MPEVFLEPFSVIKSRAQSQAEDIKSLIATQFDWLETVQPNTVKAYSTPRKARKSVNHRAKSRELEAYIVKRDNAAVGLATIISNQRVIHPTEGLYEGYDLDYWLSLNQRPQTHKTTANLLISHFIGRHNLAMRSRRQIINLTLPGLEAKNIWNYEAIASVLIDHPNPAIGFEESSSMLAVGEPAVLTTDIPGDPYGMARDGKLAQLYTYKQGSIELNKA